MNTNLESAIRTVGQLLLHRPTTGYLARNNNGTTVNPRSPEAFCFCYMGATAAVSHKFHISNIDLDRACDKVIGQMVEGEDWDRAHPETRNEWATTLANYRSPS